MNEPTSQFRVDREAVAQRLDARLDVHLGLAVALSAGSISLAGGHGKSLPSAQSVAPSAQGVVASAQSEGGCGDIGGGAGPIAKKNCLGDLFKHKAPQYEYEWVQKKKRVWTFKTPALFSGLGHKGLGGCGLGGLGGGCGLGGSTGGCDSCGGAIAAPTSYASPQAAPSSQAVYGSGQGASYGSGQAASYGSGQAASYGSGQATYSAPATFGTGQIGGSSQIVAPATDSAPAPPPAANPTTASNGNVLFMAPAGN